MRSVFLQTTSSFWRRMLTLNSQFEEDGHAEVHAQMIDENVKSGKGQLAEQESIELAEKEKERCKILFKAAQAAQRQKIIEIDEKRAPGDRKMLQDMVQKKKVLEGLTTNVYYRKYTIEEIQQDTDNFSNKLKIGKGGYGPIFKASLDHTAVAIKILHPDAAQGARQFQQELIREAILCPDPGFFQDNLALPSIN
ncbi:hypothetical protein Taro_017784 [Colocasia esculenta]|uniref:RING-type E3 ubiquitin transferase n=1 Tax=Colocasia esculenta TaxID=4460 RepID=A0A843V0F7_COLES|nr:hypothetical protein [Colocasia esculenta]